MFTVFYDGVFINFWHNKQADHWVKTTANIMGWDLSKVQVYWFSNIAKCKEFMNWKNTTNNRQVLKIEGNIIKKCSITQFYQNLGQVMVEFDAEDADQYYTSQELADYQANVDAEANTPEGEEVTYPAQWPEPKFKNLIQEEIVEEIEQIVGTAHDFSGEPNP